MPVIMVLTRLEHHNQGNSTFNSMSLEKPTCCCDRTLPQMKWWLLNRVSIISKYSTLASDRFISNRGAHSHIPAANLGVAHTYLTLSVLFYLLLKDLGWISKNIAQKNIIIIWYERRSVVTIWTLCCFWEMRLRTL